MKLNKTREELINMYISSLEEGEIPWRKRWINGSNINGISKLEYKGINQLMLNYITYKEKYKDNRWFTFKQINDLGLKLNKARGKGVPVEFFSAYNYKLKKRFNFKEYEEYINKYPEERDDFRIIDRTAIVFNGSLIEGLEPVNEPKNKINKSSFINKIINKLGVKYEEIGNQAFYNPKEDKIILPSKDLFVDEYSYYATELHELCHSTGHESRLNRNLQTKDKKEYAREELIAEISSSFLMQELNIPTFAEHYDNHKAYIQSWISILKDKPNELFKAINESNKVTKYINEQIRDKNKEKVL